MMKTSPSLIRTSCILAIASALIATGCSKKSEAPATPAAAPAPAAPATPSAAAPASDPAKAAVDLAAEARKKAEAEASAMAAEAKKKTDAAAADAKKQTDAAAAAAKQKAEDMAAAAKATPAPVSPVPSAPAAMPVDTAAATAAAGSTMDALKAQAEQLLSEYSGELATLKSGAATLKGLIDKNAAMLPAGVAAKYDEFNALLPQLSTMVDSLKNYQSADLTTLVPKLKADFGTAQKLYAEIKGMIPAM